MKVTVVGTGQLGSCIAYTLALKELTDELVLINRSPERAQGHAIDIEQASLFMNGRIHVTAGDLEASKGSSLIIVTASVPWRASPGEDTDRSQSLHENTALFRELVPPLAALSPDAILLVVTNPNDVLTYNAIELSGFPPERVIGSGTSVDSARFRHLLSKQTSIHPEDIRAYVIGEHGFTQVPCLAAAQVGGEAFERLEERRELSEKAMHSAFEVVKLKGYTEYVVASAVGFIAESILRDSCRTTPVSTLLTQFPEIGQVCASIPVVLGRKGVVRQLQPQLSKEEHDAFLHSLRTIRSEIVRSQTPPNA